MPGPGHLPDLAPGNFVMLSSATPASVKRMAVNVVKVPFAAKSTDSAELAVPTGLTTSNPYVWLTPIANPAWYIATVVANAAGSCTIRLHSLVEVGTAMEMWVYCLFMEP
jgi:hypothetical protein